jgi:DNA-binding MarR family transcriptional regulator
MTQVISARDRALSAELKGLGLRVPEWRVLAAVYSRKRLSISELSDLASIDRTTLSRTVDRMQEAGWLTRLADSDDLRVKRLSLTAAGERIFTRIWPTVDSLNRAAADTLPNGCLELLIWALAQMKSNLDPKPDKLPAAERAA